MTDTPSERVEQAREALLERVIITHRKCSAVKPLGNGSRVKVLDAECDCGAYDRQLAPVNSLTAALAAAEQGGG